MESIVLNVKSLSLSWGFCLFCALFINSRNLFTDVFESSIGTIGNIKSKNLVLSLEENRPSLIK